MLLLDIFVSMHLTWIDRIMEMGPDGYFYSVGLKNQLVCLISSRAIPLPTPGFPAKWYTIFLIHYEYLVWVISWNSCILSAHPRFGSPGLLTHQSNLEDLVQSGPLADRYPISSQHRPSSRKFLQTRSDAINKMSAPSSNFLWQIHSSMCSLDVQHFCLCYFFKLPYTSFATLGFQIKTCWLWQSSSLMVTRAYNHLRPEQSTS